MHSREGEHPFGDIDRLIILFIFIVTLLLNQFYFKTRLMLNSALALLLLISIFLFFNDFVFFKKRFLIAKCAEEYQTYKKQSSAWWPRLKRRIALS